MTKVYTYMTVGIGMAILLKLAGINTGIDWILEFFGVTETGTSLSLSVYVIAIGALLASSGVAGIVASFFGRSPDPYVFKGGFALANLLLLGSTFIGIILYTSNMAVWVATPIYVLFTIYSIGFYQSVVEWVYGGQ